MGERSVRRGGRQGAVWDAPEVGVVVDDDF